MGVNDIYIESVEPCNPQDPCWDDEDLYGTFSLGWRGDEEYSGDERDMDFSYWIKFCAGVGGFPLLDVFDDIEIGETSLGEIMQSNPELWKLLFFAVCDFVQDVIDSGDLPDEYHAEIVGLIGDMGDGSKKAKPQIRDIIF